MKIAKEILSEKNYTGSRLIEVSNAKITDLQGKLDEIQKEANPILDKLSKEYYPAVDPMYQEVLKLTEQTKDLKKQIAEITAKFREDTETLEKLEQKATLIKNKMQPMILKNVSGDLEEFEVARHTVVKDGKIFVEVFDELEEKIKQLRATKNA